MPMKGATMDTSSVQSKSTTAEVIKPITDEQIQQLKQKNKQAIADLNKSISLFLKAT